MVLKSVERALKKSGYKISFLLRFAAFAPYMVLNYGLSVTTIRHREFMFGFIGGWPWEALIVYYGYCIGNIIEILNGTYKTGIMCEITNYRCHGKHIPNLQRGCYANRKRICSVHRVQRNTQSKRGYNQTCGDDRGEGGSKGRRAVNQNRYEFVVLTKK